MKVCVKEQCGCTGIVHWTGAPPATALPSPAALTQRVTGKMVASTHSYSELSSVYICMYVSQSLYTVSINERHVMHGYIMEVVCAPVHEAF